MKKLIVSSLAVLGLAVSGYSQGVITFDSSAGTGTVSINGVLDTAQDINAELLLSSDGGVTFSPVVTLLLSASSGPSGTIPFGSIQPAAGDVSSFGGVLYDNSGNGYQSATIAAGTQVTLEVQGWLGNYSSLAAAFTAGQATGTTATFTEDLSAATSPILAAIGNMPNLNLVSTPEPTTFAIAGLGLASLLAIRRRK
ncbi:MAG TPA: PEP-CTERM sorting domain-containing protein [Verrucomicrobiae bacterium]|nr:PEP-CTERM sorting domain-containing protein [Verrucomicrobiae bacterium]